MHCFIEIKNNFPLEFTDPDDEGKQRSYETSGTNNVETHEQFM